MSLYDTQKDCRKYASYLPEIEVNGKITNKYEDYSINVLADNYCKALDENDEYNKNVYLSALILRFWYKIDKLYQGTKTCGYDYEDCFYKLYECINVACEYRAWQKPEKHTNAQACINQVLSVRGIPFMIYDANLQKNGVRASISLDEEVDDESNSTQADLIADESTLGFNDKAYDMVQELIANKLITEAIIADNIAYKDVFKHEKKTITEIDEDGNPYKYVKMTSEFWPFQLVKELNALDEDYIKYFNKTYGVELELLTNAVNNLVSANNTKKYKMIEFSRQTMATLLAN